MAEQGAPIRVLDIDLDFFLDGAASWLPKDGPRLDSSEYHPWPSAEALDFLRTNCHLTGRLPGAVVEHHEDVFRHMRAAIETGLLTAPFHVTHLDGHADLGMGDPGYAYVMSDLLFKNVGERSYPQEGKLDFGNWLLFAVANQWISDLDYVFCDGGGGDVFRWHMENFDRDARNLQLKAVEKADISRFVSRVDPPPVQALEPLVPFQQVRWDAFQASAPFDFIFLAHSPTFTPATSDQLFGQIGQQFINESAFPPLT